jgi:putative flippase GtrA
MPMPRLVSWLPPLPDKLINCLLLFFFGNVLEWHPVVSQLFATLGVLIWNYSISGFWIFKRQAA